MATKQIKFLKPYQYFVAGSIQNLPAPIADLLIKSGRAVAVEPTQVPAAKKTTKNANR